MKSSSYPLYKKPRCSVSTAIISPTLFLVLLITYAFCLQSAQSFVGTTTTTTMHRTTKSTTTRTSTMALHALPRAGYFSVPRMGRSSLDSAWPLVSTLRKCHIISTTTTTRMNSSKNSSNNNNNDKNEMNRFEPQEAVQSSSKNRRSPLENLHLLQKPKSNATPPGFLRRTFPQFPWMRLPNWLTYMRCWAIPILILSYYQPNGHVTTATIFALASATDWLDGYLARRWDACSRFGSFLDPVADKLMVSTALVLLSGRYGAFVAIPSAIILAREIAVSALREWMAQLGARDTVQVGWQGKCKTAVTMVALTILLLVPPLADPVGHAWLGVLLPTGILLTYVSAILTVTSGWSYFTAAAPYLFADMPNGSSNSNNNNNSVNNNNNHFQPQAK